MGDALIDQIIFLTGLPYDSVKAELDFLMNKKGIASESLDMDSLRELMAEYLREVLVLVKEQA